MVTVCVTFTQVFVVRAEQIVIPVCVPTESIFCTTPNTRHFLLLLSINGHNKNKIDFYKADGLYNKPPRDANEKSLNTLNFPSNIDLK